MTKSARAIFWMDEKAAGDQIRTIQRGLKKRSREINEELARAVVEEAKELGGQVNAGFAPHYTGALKSTANVEVHETEQFIGAELTYGGATGSGNVPHEAPGPGAPGSVNYAYAVHEDPARTSANHSGYKFLERGLAAFAPGFADRLRKRLRGKI